MSQAISQEKLSEILEKLDIHDVIAEYLTLKKTGKNFKALCPFHSEKTPSFHVNREKQIFHCFGCGTGGNLFNFLMKIENTGFPDAVRIAAEKAGVKIEFSAAEPALAREKTEIIEANAIACEFFQKELLSKKGEGVLEYLEHRGFGPDERKRFSLGYAPSGNLLLRHVSDSKIQIKQFETAGLVTKNDTGHYDWFRNRLMIPIFDQNGKVAGFGARTTEENQQPKYINTAENLVFKKSRILYGLNWAKESIRKNGFAIVVEGYFDLLKLHIHGLDNVIAPLGTALTDMHLKNLRRFTDKLLLVFDSDQAGSSAALRNLEAILRNGFDLRIAPLPFGFDPDNFVDNYGIDAFRKFLNEGKDFVEYKFALGSQSFDLKSVRGKVLLATEILNLVSLLPEPLEQKVYLKKVSGLLDISEDVLAERLQRIIVPGTRDDGPKAEVQEIFSNTLAEQNVIEILIGEPSWFSDILPLREMLPGSVRKLIDTYSENKTAGDTVSAFMAYIDDQPLVNCLSRVAFKQDWSDGEMKRKIFSDCVNRLCKDSYGRKIDELKKNITEKKESGTAYTEELERMQELYRCFKKGRFLNGTEKKTAATAGKSQTG